MGKSMLESKIRARADSRFDCLLQETRRIVSNNSLLKGLIIESASSVKLFSSIGPDALSLSKENADQSNILELRESIISNFEHEETNLLLSKMEQLEYLLKPDKYE